VAWVIVCIVAVIRVIDRLLDHATVLQIDGDSYLMRGCRGSAAAGMKRR